MIGPPSLDRSFGPALEAHLLGRLDFARCLALQQHLAEQLSQRRDGQVRLLLCEHPDVITVGRGGSPADVQLSCGLLRSGQIDVRWVSRGGGCLVHTPGQLAVYPIFPLFSHGLKLGEYLERLQEGVRRALAELAIKGQTDRGRHGIWGRTGQLVAIGVAVRNWVAYHGAFVNVCPRMGLFQLVETEPLHGTRMSCLVAERGGPVRMTRVRAELIRHLAAAFGCDRYHLHTGHPWLTGAARRAPPAIRGRREPPCL